MKWGLVSSRALRHRRIEIEEYVHRDGAVFPFFDSQGVVSFCMVVLPSESRLYFFIPRDSIPRVPLVGTIRLRRPTWSWSDGSYVPALDGLRHFDPDWLLRHARFGDREIIPALRRTNCCGQLPPDVNSLYFGRDLSIVRSVSRGTGESIRTVPIAKVLPALPAEADDPGTQRERGWRLNPVWTR